MAERRTDTAPAAAETQPEQTVDFNSGNPFFNMNSKKDDTPSPNRQRRSTQGFTKVVEEAEKKEEAAHEAADYNDEDGEENLYTTALIEMLRSSSSRETMKSADTRHALESGAKELTAAAPTTASMDSINMSKYDDKLLASPFDKAPKKLTREERYRNVKIDDMLSTGGVGKNFEDSAIEQYKKKKAAAKQNFKSILTLTGVLALCLIIFAVMWLNGII
jgi:hypothetical protein